VKTRRGRGKVVKEAKTAFSVLKKEIKIWQQRSQLTDLAESAGL
jgi:hypothetical protein